MRDRDGQAALDAVLREVRDDSSPEVDWQAVEQRLLSRIDVPVRPAARARGISPLLAALVIGILGGIFLLSFGSPSPDGVNATNLERTQVASSVVPQDGAALQLGQRVVAEEGPLVMRHAGRVRWTLAPGSSGEIKALEPALVVQLQSGTLFAEVVKSTAPERFVVEVGGLRVAVHGTVFSVRRTGQQAVVEVSEGVVAVGPIGAPATTLLEGGSVAKFVATGDLAGKLLESQGPVKVLPAPSRTAQAPRAAAREVLVTKNVHRTRQEPTFEEVEQALAQVESVLGRCLTGGTEQNHAVQFSLKTRVAFKVEADGSVGQYRFTPPLAPNLSECASAELSEVRFQPSQLGVHIIRDLDIKR